MDDELKSGVVQTRSTEMRLGTDGVIRGELRFEGVHLALEEVQTIFEIYGEFTREEKRPLLVDIRRLGSVDGDARRYATSDAVDSMMSAMAIVVGSTVSMVIGTLFLGFNRPNYPTRIFTDTERALLWLRGYATDDASA